MLTGLIAIVVGLLALGMVKLMKKVNEKNAKIMEERKKKKEGGDIS